MIGAALVVALAAAGPAHAAPPEPRVELERRVGTAFVQESYRQVGGPGYSVGLPYTGLEIGFIGRFDEVWRLGITLQGSLVGRRSVGVLGSWAPAGVYEDGPVVEARLSAVAMEVGCAAASGCPAWGAPALAAKGGMLELRPGWRLALGDQGFGLSSGVSVQGAWLSTRVPAAGGAYGGALLGVWVGVDL